MSPHNFNNVQRKSEGFRYGDTNAAHVQGIKQVCAFLEEKGYKTKLLWPISDGMYYHEYDIVAVNGNDYCAAFQENVYSNMFISQHVIKPYFDKMIKIIVEVDGEIHSKRQQKIKDGVAKSAAEKHMPQAKFCRIYKDDAGYAHYMGKLFGV